MSNLSYVSYVTPPTLITPLSPSATDHRLATPKRHIVLSFQTSLKFLAEFTMYKIDGCQASSVDQLDLVIVIDNNNNDAKKPAFGYGH